MKISAFILQTFLLSLSYYNTDCMPVSDDDDTAKTDENFVGNNNGLDLLLAVLEQNENNDNQLERADSGHYSVAGQHDYYDKSIDKNIYTAHDEIEEDEERGTPLNADDKPEEDKYEATGDNEQELLAEDDSFIATHSTDIDKQDFETSTHYSITNRHDKSIITNAYGFTEEDAKVLSADFFRMHKLLVSLIPFLLSDAFTSNPPFTQIFSKYFPLTPKNIKTVVQYIMNIHNNRKQLNAVPRKQRKCEQLDGCVASTAMYNPTGLVYINVKEYFSMSAIQRSGTLIHELSHQFGTNDIEIPGTEVIAYGEQLCRKLAKYDLSVENADSLVYFIQRLFKEFKYPLSELAKDQFEFDIAVLMDNENDDRDESMGSPESISRPLSASHGRFLKRKLWQNDEQEELYKNNLSKLHRDLKFKFYHKQ